MNVISVDTINTPMGELLVGAGDTVNFDQLKQWHDEYGMDTIVVESPTTGERLCLMLNDTF